MWQCDWLTYLSAFPLIPASTDDTCSTTIPVLVTVAPKEVGCRLHQWRFIHLNTMIEERIVTIWRYSYTFFIAMVYWPVPERVFNEHGWHSTSNYWPNSCQGNVNTFFFHVKVKLWNIHVHAPFSYHFNVGITVTCMWHMYWPINRQHDDETPSVTTYMYNGDIHDIHKEWH